MRVLLRILCGVTGSNRIRANLLRNLVVFAITALATYTAVAAPAQSIITLDSNTTYQTITGWEAEPYSGQQYSSFPLYKDALFDAVVNDVGINRVRLGVRSGVENAQDYWTMYNNGQIDYQTWRCVRYSTVNDDNDPNNINWAGFHFSDFDDVVDRLVLPIKQRLDARGEHLYINLNYTAFTNQMRQTGCDPNLTYIHNQPAEYAEFILATTLHLKNKYGLIPDFYEVILEPDNVPEWSSGTTIGNAILVTAAKLEANGYTPRFIVPSTTSMANAPSYFSGIAQVLGPQNVKKYIEELAYHRYQGVSDGALQTIANLGMQYGINTSMLEWWDANNSYLTLHKDLKMGRNSAWQQNAVLGILQIDQTDPNNPQVVVPTMTKFTRQYFKFIHSGAQRIGAFSQDTNFDPLAFVNKDGTWVVVTAAAAGGSFSIQGLPAGTYGIKYTTATAYDVDLPDVPIAAGGVVNASIPGGGAITVYGKTESGPTPTPGMLFSVYLAPIFK